MVLTYFMVINWRDRGFLDYRNFLRVTKDSYIKEQEGTVDVPLPPPSTRGNKCLNLFFLRKIKKEI